MPPTVHHRPQSNPPFNTFVLQAEVWLKWKHTLTNHDSLGDANSVLQKGVKQASGTWCQMKPGQPRYSWGTHTREHILGVSGHPHIENLATDVVVGSRTEIPVLFSSHPSSIQHDSDWKPVGRDHMNVASTLHQMWDRQGGSMLLGVSGANMLILGHQNLFFVSGFSLQTWWDRRWGRRLFHTTVCKRVICKTKKKAK